MAVILKDDSLVTALNISALPPITQLQGSIVMLGNSRRCEMSVVTMNMSGYEIERDDPIACGADAMHKGWIPALAMQEITGARKPAMPPELVLVDAETFLTRMCAYPQ